METIERNIIDILFSKDIDVLELNEYLNVALIFVNNVCSSPEDELYKVMYQELNYKTMDNTIKLTIILNVLNQEEKMQSFVTQKSHPNRKRRIALDRAIASPWLEDLSIQCELYNNSQIDEVTLIKKSKKMYRRLKKENKKKRTT